MKETKEQLIQYLYDLYEICQWLIKTEYLKPLSDLNVRGLREIELILLHNRIDTEIDEYKEEKEK